MSPWRRPEATGFRLRVPSPGAFDPQTSIKSAAAAIGRAVDRESVRIATLGVATLSFYAPFLTGCFIGAADAQDYNRLLADFLTQIRSGVFPVYLSQTEFGWIGRNLVQRPSYYYLGGLLDLLTGRSLDAVVLQHLTVLTSALGGVYAMYWALRRLDPARPRTAWCLALLYVTCPGVMGLIFMMDMYASFMTVPWLPLLLFGIVRSFDRRDLRSAALIGGSLAMLWMAHAPIGLWSTALAALCGGLQIAFTRPRLPALRCWASSAAVFAVLGGWYFASVFSVGADRNNVITVAPHERQGFFVNPGYVRSVEEIQRSTVPGALLPLAATPLGLTDLQLGYALWFAVALAAATVFLRSASAAQRVLAAAAVVVCLYLFPVPYVTRELWLRLPRTFAITYFWPQQRLYAILAAVACFAGMPALRHLQGTTVARRVLHGALLLVLCGWAAAEAYKFRQTAKLYRSPIVPPPVLFAENTDLRDPPPHYVGHVVYDAALENRLIRSSDGAVIASNARHVAEHARNLVEATPEMSAAERVAAEVEFPYVGGRKVGYERLLTFELAAGERRMLTMRTRTKNFHGHLTVAGEGLERIQWLPSSTDDFQTVAIPVWSSRPNAQTITVDLVTGTTDAQAEIELVSCASYDPTKLPVGVRSIFPYRAVVDAAEPCGLETHRLHAPGYRTLVNGREVALERSPTGMAVIPLEAGRNEIEMRYVGTPAMNAAFVVSGGGWLAFLAAAVVPPLRRRLRRTVSDRNVESPPAPARRRAA